MKNTLFKMAVALCFWATFQSAYSHNFYKDSLQEPIDTPIVVSGDSLRYMPFQYSLLHPLGTNGTEAESTINNFSLNILIGYQGGLDGVEIGGFANTLRYDMKGAQFAGFSNIVMGEVEGAQFSGFVNVSRAYVEGGQFGGFINIAGDSLNGIQGAGFANVINGSSEAVQGAGFINVVKGKFTGVQASGFTNVCGDSLEGLQGTGFINIAHGSVKGGQFAGFANIATGDVEGIQAAGFINVARNVHGLQVGVINVADTVTGGIPIGVISFVKNGYFGFELGASESLYANASFKLGVRQFYNIFTFGFTPKQENFVHAYGYGAGTQITFSERFHNNVELVVYHVNETNSDEGTIGTKDLNLLTTLKSTFGYSLGKRTEVFAGPSFNVLTSQRKMSNGEIGSDMPAYTFYHFQNNRSSVQLWAGFTAGVRF